jgi:hypothetical protein
VFAVGIPAMRPVFHVAALSMGQWAVVVVSCLIVLFAVELAKMVSRGMSARRGRNHL